MNYLEIKTEWASKLAGAIQIPTVSRDNDDLSLEVKSISKEIQLIHNFKFKIENYDIAKLVSYISLIIGRI